MNRNDNQDNQLQQELAKLKAEHQRLRDEKLRTEQDVAHLSGQLKELQDRARQEYGTSDPAELLAILEEKRGENAAMVAEYRDHLLGIHNDLQAVEQRVEQQDDPELAQSGSGQHGGGDQ